MAAKRSQRKNVIAILGVALTRSMGMILAMGVSALMANRFGAGLTTDGFFFARRLAMGFSESAQRVTNTVLIPGLAAKLNDLDTSQAPQAWRRYLGRVLLFGLPATALAAVLAPQIVGITGPGFTPEGTELASHLLRILLFIIPLTIFKAVSGSLLNAGRVFAAPATLALLSRFLVVIALLFFVPPWSVDHLAWTMLTGAAIAAIILTAIARDQLPLMLAAEKKIETEVKGEPARLFWPGFLIFFTSQAFIWLEFGYASTLGSGAISEMEYGYRILAILPGVVSASMTTVMYTEFSHLAAQGQKQEMYRTLAQVTRGGLFFITPLIAFLAFQGENIAGVLLNHGAFQDSSTGVIGDVMMMMAFSAVGLYFSRIYVFGLYADESAPVLRMVLIIVGVTLATRLLFINLLIGSMGVAGIALARSISTLCRVLTVYLLLYLHWGKFIQRRDLAAMAGILLFSAAAMGSTALLDDWLGFTPDKSFIVRLIGLGVVGVVGFVIYFGLAYAFRLPEIKQVRRFLRKKVPGLG
ncbi:hypothetical protein KJ682_11675 [bacterium]|nr:hypothetical protein [bacterium]